MTPLLLGLAAACFLLAAACSCLPGRAWQRAGFAAQGAGLACLAGLIAALWLTLGRPPLRTLGETRLWYAALTVAIGLGLEWRLGTSALRLPMLGFALLFCLLGLALPESFDRTLMPALLSPWFVPHVVVNLVAYAALALAGGAAGLALWRGRGLPEPAALALPGVLAKVGLVFLTLGLAFGALWAKEAWGHYWSWDPKEAWAYLSWCVCVCAMHLGRETSPRTRAWTLVAAMAMVFTSWFVVSSLPAARTSVHTYAWAPAP
jgi:ABC-type transport system involved in cytochrome c biogenesis permease subunit